MVAMALTRDGSGRLVGPTGLVPFLLMVVAAAAAAAAGGVGASEHEDASSPFYFPPYAPTYINVAIPHSLYVNYTMTTSTWSGANVTTYGYVHRRGDIGSAFAKGHPMSLPPQGSMSLNAYYFESEDFCTVPPFGDRNASSSSLYPNASSVVVHPPRPSGQDGDDSRHWPHSPYIAVIDHVRVANGTAVPGVVRCTYTTKVRNAQLYGAAAVLIADVDSDPDCPPNGNSSDDNGGGGGGKGRACGSTFLPRMSDDGSGADVSIPSFLLETRGADAIKATLVGGTPVLVEVRWHPRRVGPGDGSGKDSEDSHEAQGPAVEYATWLDLLDDVTKAWHRDCLPVAKALGSKARYRPGYVFHDGSLSGCIGDGGGGNVDNDLDRCSDMCINSGRYCYPSSSSLSSPSSPTSAGEESAAAATATATAAAAAPITGSSVMLEILRRLCVWEYSNGTSDGVGRGYWDYVTYFDAVCDDGTNATFTDVGCIHAAYSAGNADADEVENCMIDTGDPKEDGRNRLLDEMLLAKVEHGVFYAPMAFANHERLAWDGRDDDDEEKEEDGGGDAGKDGNDKGDDDNGNDGDTDGDAATAVPIRKMLKTICDAYESNYKPKVCSRCVRASDVVLCASKDDDDNGGGGGGNDHHHGGDDSSSHPTKKGGHGFRNFVLFFMFASLGGAGYYYYFYRMRDSRSDSNWNLRYALLGDRGDGDHV